MLNFQGLLKLLLVGILTYVSVTPFAAYAEGRATDFDRTCQFFTNQAFKDRRGRLQATFRMQMAQDCVDAMIYAADVDPLTQDRALDYLTQMESYRSVVTSMLTERASNPAPWLAGENGSVRRVLQPVSRAGAYLIARDMGLVEQHEDWTQWRRSAALPLFRLDEMTSSRHHN